MEQTVLCKKCSAPIEVINNQCWFYETGLGYSVKLMKCPECSTINVIKCYEDPWLDVNNDKRYYIYS